MSTLLNRRRAMMMSAGSSIDWESIARGMTDYTTPFSVPAGIITSLIDSNFYGRFNLINVELPSTITSIPNSTFFQCQKLESIDIPSTVTSIGSYAFYQCYALTFVIVRATTPPTLNSDLGGLGAKNDCPIYVPDESVNTYKTSNNWSRLASRIKGISEKQ